MKPNTWKRLRTHLPSFFQWKIFFSFLVVSILFQNCVIPKSFTIDSPTILSQKEQETNNTENSGGGGGGNGYGYEGKPDGIYVRTVDKINCPNHILSKITIDSSKQTITKETLESVETCKYQTENITSVDLKTSLLNTNLLKYKDGLFIKKETLNDSNTNGTLASVNSVGSTFSTEVTTSSLSKTSQKTAPQMDQAPMAWCQDNKNLKEIIIYQDNNFQMYDIQSKVSIKDTVQKMEVKGQKISIFLNTGKNFIIHANLTQTNSNGSFLGKYSSSDAENYDCFLGVKFDGFIWPAQQILESNINEYIKIESLNNKGILYSKNHDSNFTAELNIFNVNDLQITKVFSVLPFDNKFNIQNFNYFPAIDKIAVHTKQLTTNDIYFNHQNYFIDFDDQKSPSEQSYNFQAQPAKKETSWNNTFFDNTLYSNSNSNSIFFTETIVDPYKMYGENFLSIGSFDLSKYLYNSLNISMYAKSQNIKDYNSLYFNYKNLINENREIPLTNSSGQLYTFNLINKNFEIISPVLNPDSNSFIITNFSTYIITKSYFKNSENKIVSVTSLMKKTDSSNTPTKWEFVANLSSISEFSKNIFPIYSETNLNILKGFVYLESDKNFVFNYNIPKPNNKIVHYFNLETKKDMVIYDGVNDNCTFTNLIFNPHSKSEFNLICHKDFMNFISELEQPTLTNTNVNINNSVKLLKFSYNNNNFSKTEVNLNIDQGTFVNAVKIDLESERMFFIAERIGRPKELFMYDTKNDDLRIISNRFYMLGDVLEFEVFDAGKKVIILNSGLQNNLKSNYYLKSLYLWSDEEI